MYEKEGKKNNNERSRSRMAGKANRIFSRPPLRHCEHARIGNHRGGAGNIFRAVSMVEAISFSS